MASPEYFELLPSPPHAIPGFAAWHSLEVSRQAAPLAPSFLLGGWPAALARSYYSHVDVFNAGVFTLQDMTVVERGFLRHAGIPVACNYASMSAPLLRDFIARGLIRPDDSYRRIDVDTAALLLTIGYDVYGHWLVDFLPKLHLLAEAGHDIATLSYLVPTDVPDFGMAWLRLLGVREEQFIRYDPQTQTVRVRRLLLPTMARQAHRALDIFPACAAFLQQQLARHHQWTPPATADRRLFVSRSRSGRDGRTLVNRSEIEAMATARGYEIVHPETLPMIDQVSLFRGARTLIGEYGSAMHGSMFSPPGTAVCVLRGATYHPGFLQSGLCQVQRQSCGYVLGEAPIDAVNYDFTIDPADFDRALSLLDL